MWSDRTRLGTGFTLNLWLDVFKTITCHKSQCEVRSGQTPKTHRQSSQQSNREYSLKSDSNSSKSAIKHVVFFLLQQNYYLSQTSTKTQNVLLNKTNVNIEFSYVSLSLCPLQVSNNQRCFKQVGLFNGVWYNKLTKGFNNVLASVQYMRL